MDTSSALSSLAMLTAGLKPTATTTEADLNTARAALAGSLLAHAVHPAAVTSGLPTTSFASVSANELKEFEQLLNTTAAAKVVTPSPLVFLRNLPAIPVGNPALTPSSVAGMMPKSIGPFTDNLGRLHWFDIYPPVSQTAISRVPMADPFLLLPVSIPSGPVPTTLHVERGSLWIAAQTLTPTAPAGGYVGLAITGGSLVLSNAPIASVNGLQVAAATTLTLTVTLVAAPAPVESGSPGADGGAVVAKLPTEVTFVFSASGTRITSSSNASLKVYGNTVGLQWKPAAPVYEPALAQILIPLRPEVATFTPTNVLSKFFQPFGKVKISGGAWALPVAVAAPQQLGTAATTGLLALRLNPGLSGKWEGLEGGSAALGSLFLEGAGGMLSLAAAIRNPTQLSNDVNLWPSTVSPDDRSSIDITFSTGALLYYTSIANYAGTSHVEIFSSGVSLSAHIDRPLAADGGTLGPSSMPGTLAVFLTSSVNGVVITGIASAEDRQGANMSLALRNALIVTTPPLLLIVAGTFTTTPATLNSGGLLLAFGVERLVPTLPDPYAANFLPRISRRSDLASSTSTTPLLLSTVLWSPATDVQISFSDSPLGLGVFQVQPLPASPAPIIAGTTGEEDFERITALTTLFNETIGSQSPELFLLDVSSNVDHFGVAMSLPIDSFATVGRAVTDTVIESPATPAASFGNVSGQAFSITGLDLVAPCSHLRVFTVPSVQWEPVVTLQNPKVLPYPFPSPAGFLNNGGPTFLGAADITLVPVAPAPLLKQVILAYAGGKAGAAQLTLPFGMTALVAVPARPKLTSVFYRRPNISMIEPAFAPQKMAGGHQLSLTAPNSFLNSSAKSPSLPGATVQLRNLVDKNGNPVLYKPITPTPPGGLQLSVLGPDVDQIFNEQFAPGMKGQIVPITRIDLSGYGASSFSAWTDPTANIPAVVQVRFNMMIGRANREVVQVKSVLYPWGAIVVRTITIDRQDNGQVYRSDSGWVAATPGIFGAAGITVHPGAVRGAFNIREIRDTTQTFKTSSGAELVGVYFDADIQIDGVVTGASGGLVPSTGQFGWVQTGPVGMPVTADELASLIAAKGAPGGPVDCVISVAGTAQTMRISRVEVGNAPHIGAPEPAEFAAAARGSLVLPQPGNWSILSRIDNVSEPSPVDPDLGVPLIQQGAAGTAASTMPWRLAEPVDLWIPNSPSKDYCLLHATDSTRVLFPRPRIALGAHAFTSDQTPLLADGFALMNSTFVCPRQDSCLTFPNADYALIISGAGAFTLTNVPASFASSLPRRSLAADSAGAVWFEYSDGASTPSSTQISVVINPANWSINLAPINVRVDIAPFDGVIRTVGGVQASSAGGVSFQNAQFVLGSVMSPLEDLFVFLSELGLPNPLNLAFSNSGSKQSISYKLNAGIAFKLPSPLLPKLTPILQPPDGPWKIGLSMKFGFGNVLSVASSSTATTITEQWMYYFNLGGSNKPVNMQWEIIPGIPVFVGFLLGFGVSHQFASGSIPASTQVSFQVGGIVSLGGDLIPKLVHAEISLSLAFNFVLGFAATDTATIGVALTMAVSASIADGLFAISFSASAAGNIIDSDPTSLTLRFLLQASFSVSVDVTVCWLVDVSFSESFQYTQSLPAISL